MKFHHKHTYADYDASPPYLLWSQPKHSKPNQTPAAAEFSRVSSSQLPRTAAMQTTYMQFNWLFF